MIDATPHIIEEIASELGLPLEQVQKAAASQFYFTAHIMADDSFRTIRLQYLGKWTVSPRRLREMRRIQLEGRNKPTKSGRNKVVNRPDNYDDINEWEKQRNLK